MRKSHRYKAALSTTLKGRIPSGTSRHSPIFRRLESSCKHDGRHLEREICRWNAKINGSISRNAKRKSGFTDCWTGSYHSQFPWLPTMSYPIQRHESGRDSVERILIPLHYLQCPIDGITYMNSLTFHDYFVLLSTIGKPWCRASLHAR